MDTPDNIARALFLEQPEPEETFAETILDHIGGVLGVLMTNLASPGEAKRRPGLWAKRYGNSTHGHRVDTTPTPSGPALQLETLALQFTQFKVQMDGTLAKVRMFILVEDTAHKAEVTAHQSSTEAHLTVTIESHTRKLTKQQQGYNELWAHLADKDRNLASLQAHVESLSSKLTETLAEVQSLRDTPRAADQPGRTGIESETTTSVLESISDMGVKFSDLEE